MCVNGLTHLQVKSGGGGETPADLGEFLCPTLLRFIPQSSLWGNSVLKEDSDSKLAFHSSVREMCQLTKLVFSGLTQHGPLSGKPVWLIAKMTKTFPSADQQLYYQGANLWAVNVPWFISALPKWWEPFSYLLEGQNGSLLSRNP